MSYGSYRARLHANGGSIVDANKLATKRSQLKEIKSSPLRADVYLNMDESVKYMCIPRDINNYETRSFLFEPDTKVNKGDYIGFDGFNYLITGANTSDIHPLVTAQLCNHSFPIRTIITKTQIGTDPRSGRPIYDEEPEVISIPCIVESKYTHANDTRSFQIPEDRLTISLKHTIPNNIDLNFEFDMYNDKYRIIDIDSTQTINEVGIMKITAEKV